MNYPLSDKNKYNILKKGIISYYRLAWQSLADALRGFETYPREYYEIMFMRIDTLAPIVFYAYDFFPLRDVYVNLSNLRKEIEEKLRKRK